MAIPDGTIGLLQLATTPQNPAPGSLYFFTKTDGNAYILNSSGTLSVIGSVSAITGLTGDVTATGPGSVSATVVSVGGQTASNIAAAVVLINSATSTNVPSTPVLRDPSGDFSAGVITASLNGNASTANSAVTAISFSGALAGDVTGNQSTTHVALVGGQTAAAVAAAAVAVADAASINTPGTLVERDGTGSFNAGTVTASSFIGNVTGNVSGSAATFTGSLSGDVTGTQSATTVTKIQGFAVSNTAPTDAQVLIYNSTTNHWVPVNFSGDVSLADSGATAIASSTVTSKLLTGYSVGSNTAILATDTILAAFEKVQGQINATTGAAITALSGDGTASGPGAVIFTLATVNPNVGSFGSQNTVATFTVNGKGLITAASNVTIGNLSNSNLNGSAGITGANIASSTISNTNLAQMAANTVKANTTASPANPVDTALGTVTETGSSVLTLLNWGDATIGSPTIQVTQSSGSVSGYLSSTDWNTFNNKQPAGNYITALSGDVTAAGPGNAVTTVAKIQGTTVSGTTGTGDVVFNNAPSFVGSINMGGFSITSLAAPVSPNDAVNKNYVDVTAVGIYPQTPIIIVNLINDSLSTPPGSPVPETTYLIGPSPTGAWASIGAGHFAWWDGSMWHDGLMRAVQVGDRLGINFHNAGTLGGGLVGEQNAIATVTNATPGSYAYTFATPANRWTVLDNNSFSQDAGNTYYYNTTSWVEVATGFVTNPGIGLSNSGVIWNVNYDNSTIGINGSNQLYVLNSGITNTQIANDTISYAKIQNETPSTLLGNPSGVLQNPGEITLGATLAFVGSALQTTAQTGDVTTSANSFATTVAKIQGTVVAGTTGSGNVVFSASPTLTGTLTAAAISATSLTDTSLTAGSIPYIGAGGLITQDNANFYWSDSIVSLGIGGQPNAATVITAINSTGAAKPIQLIGYGAGSTLGIRGDFARGSSSIPSAAQAGDVLNFFSGRGYGTSQFATSSTGVMQIVAGETFTNSSNATYLTFKTTPTSSVASSERMRINSNGNVLIGTTTDAGQLLQVNGTLSSGAITAPSMALTSSSTSVLTINTSSFIFDSVNNTLGIGAQPITASLITAVNTSGAAKPVQLIGYGTGSSTGVRGDFARGTSSSPTATQAGDVLNFISARGYGASQFASSSTGVMQLVAGEAFTNTSNATYIAFKTTPTGSVTSSERIRINSTGNILIGTTTDNGIDTQQVNGSILIEGTAGAGYVGFSSQASAPSTPSSGFRVYADNTNRFSWIGTNGFSRTFDGTSLTASRVYTLPDFSGQIATAQMSTAFIAAGVTLTFGANVATNAALGNIFTLTLTGSANLSAPTNPVNGQKITYRITQDSTGGRVLTFDPIFNFGNAIYAQTLTPNKTDYIGCIYNSSTVKWDVVAFSRGF